MLFRFRLSKILSVCEINLNGFVLDYSYWKVNSRKVFAVPRDEVDKRTQHNSTTTRNNQHQEIMAAIADVQRTLNSTNYSTLIQPLKQALTCLVCRDLCTSPVIFGLCCRQVLGCRDCIAQYRVNEDACLHCRVLDFSTIEFTTFDEVLQILRQNNL